MANKKYTYSAIIRNSQFRKYKDILPVVLDNTEKYTLEDVNKKVKEHLTRKVGA